MFETIRPEEAGISSEKVLEFMKIIDEGSPATHSVIMARKDKIFHECYYAPFTKDFKHRMYSVSKTFVSVAAGLLIEDGVLHFDDKLVYFFPEYLTGSESGFMKELTIRDMLVMETGSSSPADWFHSGADDRCKVYFQTRQNKIPKTLFDYDSPGSFMLCAIVEKITKKPFLEFLQERFLNDIGFSKDAYCLKVPGGWSFGDSGVMCTSRDLLTFARFVLNKGTWNGIRYMNRQYLADASRKQVDNNNLAVDNYNTNGYGYQIWIGRGNAFSFNGMGGQFAVCDPEKDFIFVITADNQGNVTANAAVHQALYHHIIENLGEPLPRNDEKYNELISYCSSRRLFALKNETETEFVNELNGTTYYFEENPMGIEKMCFNFNGGKGSVTYTNRTGEKTLVFGIGYNEFGKFPEEGYSDMVAATYEPNHFYECAASAAWVEEKKLRIKVQVIDKYFGNGAWTFGFKDNRVTLRMTKNAEAFMEEYEGTAVGTKVRP